MRSPTDPYSHAVKEFAQCASGNERKKKSADIFLLTMLRKLHSIESESVQVNLNWQEDTRPQITLGVSGSCRSRRAPPLQLSACTRTHSTADYRAYVSSRRSKSVAPMLVEKMDSKYVLVFTHSTTRVQSSPGNSMPRALFRVLDTNAESDND